MTEHEKAVYADADAARYHAQYLLESLVPSLHEMNLHETARDVADAARMIIALTR